MKYNSITEINKNELDNITGGLCGVEIAIFAMGCSVVMTGISIGLGALIKTYSNSKSNE